MSHHKEPLPLLLALRVRRRGHTVLELMQFWLQPDGHRTMHNGQLCNQRIQARVKGRQKLIWHSHRQLIFFLCSQLIATTRHAFSRFCRSFWPVAASTKSGSRSDIMVKVGWSDCFLMTNSTTRACLARTLTRQDQTCPNQLS